MEKWTKEVIRLFTEETQTDWYKLQIFNLIKKET